MVSLFVPSRHFFLKFYYCFHVTNTHGDDQEEVIVSSVIEILNVLKGRYFVNTLSEWNVHKKSRSTT